MARRATRRPAASPLPPEGLLVVGPGTVFAGRYRSRHKIARGGMSTVWAGIVHRDVKPHNLFLAEQDGEEVVKLLDFGVAKHAGTAALRTRTGLMVGSPSFMSPEQVRGAREVDARSDLFSLGAVAYLCLTGRTPFGGAMPAVFLAILEGKPPAASSLRPGLTGAVDRFFERALAVDPAARFGSAIELAASLREKLGEPARGAPPALRDHEPVSERLPVRLPQRSRPRVVVEGDEPARPSELPTAISAVPTEILLRESASTVMPPPPASPAPGGESAEEPGSEPSASSPPISRAPTPRVVAMPVAALPRADGRVRRCGGGDRRRMGGVRLTSGGAGRRRDEGRRR